MVIPVSVEQLVTLLFNAGVVVSVIATVLSLGMSFTVSQLVAPLRRWLLVLAVVVVNCFVIPACAWGITSLFGLPVDSVTGVTLATIGAGSAVSLKAAQLSRRADLPLAVSLVIVLQLLNLAVVPLWAGRVVSGASISAGSIFRSLLALVLVPLVIGLLVGARYHDQAAAWRAGCVTVANLALGTALVTGIAANWAAIVALVGSRTLLASVVIAVTALLLGGLVDASRVATRTATALVSGLRFGSLGLIIIGTQLDGNPAVLGAAIVFALVNLITGMLTALEIGRRPVAPAADQVPPEA